MSVYWILLPLAVQLFLYLQRLRAYGQGCQSLVAAVCARRWDQEGSEGQLRALLQAIEEKLIPTLLRFGDLEVCIRPPDERTIRKLAEGEGPTLLRSVVFELELLDRALSDADRVQCVSNLACLALAARSAFRTTSVEGEALMAVAESARRVLSELCVAVDLPVEGQQVSEWDDRVQPIRDGNDPNKVIRRVHSLYLHLEGGDRLYSAVDLREEAARPRPRRLGRRVRAWGAGLWRGLSSARVEATVFACSILACALLLSQGGAQ